MNRDPFNVRRSPLPAFQLLRNGADTIQRTASQASQRIVSAIGEPEPDEVGQKKKVDDELEDTQEDISAATMSYALPQNGPTQRHPDQWSRGGQNGQSEGGFGEKMNNMFNPERRDSLPMYKDKPFGYPGSSRRSAWKKKRTVGLVLGSLAGLSWWFGVLSPLSYLSGDGGAKTTPSSSSSWSLFGNSKPTTNWDERAQSVREAFQLSWTGYEKYAWGMLCRLEQRVLLIKQRETLTSDCQDSTNFTQKAKMADK
jgi:mannosyl-oligosaccharide alpha-1,2-mannosidase